MYDYVTYAVCNFVPYYRACYYVSVITDWFDIWINILIESSLLAYEMCQVILLMLCSIVWYVYRFLNIILMGFDRYRCVLDRIFPFSKLPEYRRRFRFRKYRTAFVSDKKMWKWKWWSLSPIVSDRFHPYLRVYLDHFVFCVFTFLSGNIQYLKY